MARKPIDISVAADLAVMACRFPNAYASMCHYYYTYLLELELFTKRQPSNAVPPLMPLTNNYLEFEKQLAKLNEMAKLNVKPQDAGNYFEAVRP